MSDGHLEMRCVAGPPHGAPFPCHPRPTEAHEGWYPDRSKGGPLPAITGTALGTGPRDRPRWSTEPEISIQSDRTLTATGVLADSAVGTGGISVYVIATGVVPEIVSVPLAGDGAYPLVVATE